MRLSKEGGIRMSITRIMDSVFESISIDKRKKLGTADRTTESLGAVEGNFFLAFNNQDNKNRESERDAKNRGRDAKTLEEQWKEAQEMVNLAKYREEFLGTHIDSRG